MRVCRKQITVMRRSRNIIKTVLAGALVLSFSSDAHLAFSQGEVLFSTNPAFVVKEKRPKYYSVSCILENGEDTLKYYTPTVVPTEMEASIDADLAYLIKNRPGETVVWNYKPQAFTIQSRGNSLFVYQTMPARKDTIVFDFDSLNRVNNIRATTQIWQYDTKKKEGYTMSYSQGRCFYDEQSRVVRLEEKYVGEAPVPELYVNWYCHYEKGNLKYYLKYESYTKNGPYKLSGIFLMHYSGSPKPPAAKRLEKEFKEILKKTLQRISV